MSYRNEILFSVHYTETVPSAIILQQSSLNYYSPPFTSTLPHCLINTANMNEMTVYEKKTKKEKHQQNK